MTGSELFGFDSISSKEWYVARAAANEIFTKVATKNIHSALLQARRQVDTAYAKLQNCEEYVANLETQLNIEERWTEDSPDYKHNREQVALWDYYEALDELERLVVQRLFELSKLGMSGTGKPSVY